MLVPDPRERCHRISSDQRYISFDGEGFIQACCTSADSENVVEICPTGVQLVIRSLSVRKGNTKLMEAVNRIIPYLYIQDIRDKQEKIFRQKVMASRNAIEPITQTFKMGTIIGLVILLFSGHLCAFMFFIFELIIGNRVKWLSLAV